jgi:hypothetical protein
MGACRGTMRSWVPNPREIRRTFVAEDDGLPIGIAHGGMDGKKN